MHIIQHVVAVYAVQFQKALIEDTDSYDLPRIGTTFAKLLDAMPEESRRLLGITALIHSWHGHRGKKYKELANDVKEGKSTLMISEDGKLYRVAAVVVLRLVRGDGRILARLGRKDTVFQCSTIVNDSFL